MDDVEAFVFDVFGTVVDWRGSVTEELIRLGQKYSLPGVHGILSPLCRFLTRSDLQLKTTTGDFLPLSGDKDIFPTRTFVIIGLILWHHLSPLELRTDFASLLAEKAPAMLMCCTDRLIWMVFYPGNLQSSFLVDSRRNAEGSSLVSLGPTVGRRGKSSSESCVASPQGQANLFLEPCSDRIDVFLGWPDATEGLYALKKRAIISTLSNGNVRLLVDMVRNNFPAI